MSERREYERVHHPAYYNAGDVEHCEMVEDQGHADGYYFGQVTKYAFRAGQKPGEPALYDLQKMHWYAARWLVWRRYGKRIWKIARVDPEFIFNPQLLEQKVGEIAPD